MKLRSLFFSPTRLSGGGECELWPRERREDREHRVFRSLHQSFQVCAFAVCVCARGSPFSVHPPAPRHLDFPTDSSTSPPEATHNSSQDEARTFGCAGDTKDLVYIHLEWDCFCASLFRKRGRKKKSGSSQTSAYSRRSLDQSRRGGAGKGK